MPICQECNKEFKVLNSNHLAQHGLTLQAYIDKYGDPNKSSLGAGRKSTSASAVTKKKKEKSETVLSSKQTRTIDDLLELEKTIVVPSTFYWVDQSNPEILDTVIALCYEYGMVSVDTETTGLDPFLDRVTHIILTPHDPGRKYNILIPLYHENEDGTPMTNLLSTEYVLSKVRPLLEDPNMSTNWFNLYFDGVMLYNSCKVDVANICPAKYLPKLVNDKMVYTRWDKTVDKWTGGWDASIAAQILNENEPSHKMKDIYKKYLYNQETDPAIRNLNVETFEEQFGDIRFFRVPKKIATCYGAKDGYITRKLYEFQRPYIESIGDLDNILYTIEFPLIKPLYQMRIAGIKQNLETAKTIGDELEIKRSGALEKVKAVLGDINLNSPKQVAHALFEEQGLPDLMKGSTKSAALEELADLGYDVASDLIQYKKAEKLKSSFIDKAAETIAADGRVHCQFNQLGTRCITGDSLILSPEGLKPLKTYIPTGLVGEQDSSGLIVNRLGKLEEYSGVYASGLTETIRLDCGFGFSIEGTKDHRVLVHSDYNLKTRPFPSPKALSCKIDPCYNSWRSLKDIKEGDYIYMPIGQNIGPTEYFKLPVFIPEYKTCAVGVKAPSFLDERMAEFLGMIIADGSIHTANGGWSLRLSNDDEEVQLRYKTLVKDLFGLEASTTWAHTTYITSFNSVTLGDWLESLGLEHGARNKHIPLGLDSSPLSVVKAFIRGLTLDSSLDTKNGRVRLKLASKGRGILKWVHTYLLNLGIVGSYVEYTGKYEGLQVLDITGSDYAEFRDSIGFIESSKYYSGALSRYNYKRVEKDTWLVVKSIQTSTAETYDFIIPDTHSFIANGLVNHNTGRFSSSRPNLQQVPAKFGVIRTMFESGDPDLLLLGADLSQIEPRLTSHTCNDEHMIDTYLANKDLYSMMASKVFTLLARRTSEELNQRMKTTRFDRANPVHGMAPIRVQLYKDGFVYFDESTNDFTFKELQPEDCYDGTLYRKMMKTLLLGMTYGMTEKGLSARLKVSEEDAIDIMNDFFDAFPSLKRTMKQLNKLANKSGFIETEFGRKRRIPDIWAEEKWIRQKAERQLFNSLIQGGAADIMKILMICQFYDPRLAEMGVKLLLTVHDEVIAACPRDKAVEGIKLLIRDMTEPLSFRVPLKADGEIYISGKWNDTSISYKGSNFKYEGQVISEDQVRELCRRH